MTFIHFRAADAANQNAAHTADDAVVGEHDVPARFPAGWICSDDFTDDDPVFAAIARRSSTQRFALEVTPSVNNLVFQKDVDGAWQFTRAQQPAGAPQSVCGSDATRGDTLPHADTATVIVIEIGPRLEKNDVVR